MNKTTILIGNTTPNSDLPAVKTERAAIRTALQKRSQEVSLIVEPDLTFGNLVDIFLKHDDGDRIELFHYTGHSGKDGVLLEDGTSAGNDVSVQAFSDFLSNRKNLKIVFLNSCSSKYIGKQLIDNGSVKVVIETTQPVYDNDAKYFSEAFYLSLADGKTIQEAFDEAKNILDNTPNDKRGEPIPRGIGFEQDDFPWRLHPTPNDPEDTVNTWRLYEPIEKRIADFKGIKVLCVFPEANYTKECYNAVKEVLNDIKKEVTEEAVYIESFVNLEKQGAINSVDKFDSYLFFAAKGSISFLDKHKDLFKPFIQNKTVGVLSCEMGIDANLNDRFDKEIEEVIELPYGIKDMSIDQFIGDLVQAKLLKCKDKFKPLLSHKNQLEESVISSTLKTAFIDLNFKDQRMVIEDLIKKEIAQYNIFSIEGTEHCGHEVLIKKIISLMNTHTIWEEVKTSIVSLSQHFDAIDVIEEEDIWSVIADEVLGSKKLSRSPDADKITNELMEIIKKQNTIVSIHDAEFNPSSYEAIKSFWKTFSDKVSPLDTTNKLFFFVLNKGISKGCCFSDKPIASYAQCSSIPLKPISPMDVGVFQSWYSSGLLQATLKGDERFIKMGRNKLSLLKEPFVAKVIGQICAQMNCKDIQQDVLTIKSRMQE